MFSCIFQCEKTKADICICERREAGFSKLKQIYSRRPLWICSKKRSLQICSVLLSFNQNLGSTDIFERSWVSMEEEASTGMSGSCIFQSEPGFSESKMGCIQEKLVFFYRLEQIQDEEGQEEGSLAIDNFNSCINCVRSFVMTYSQLCRCRAL